MHSSFIPAGGILLVAPAETTHDLGQDVHGQPWHLARVDTPAHAMRSVRQNLAIDAVLIAPGRSLGPYVDLCRSIKLESPGRRLQVIFMLSPHAANRSTEIWEAGADDCIHLPASSHEIGLRLRRAIHLKHATDSLEETTAVVVSLANAVEGRESYTCGHVQRVAMYSVEIGKRVGVAEEELAVLKTGSLVHDIGKVLVPDHVLNKPGELTEAEWDIVKRHPAAGYDILQPMQSFRDALPIVRWHHERPNGTGYPDGLQGRELPLLPRIVAVADCFDAISTDRPYRLALPPSKCREILLRAGDHNDLDPMLVDQLLDMFLSSPSEAVAIAG